MARDLLQILACLIYGLFGLSTTVYRYNGSAGYLVCLVLESNLTTCNTGTHEDNIDSPILLAWVFGFKSEYRACVGLCAAAAGSPVATLKDQKGAAASPLSNAVMAAS